MVDWAGIQTDLPTWATAQMGIPVFWRDQPRPMVTTAWGLLNVSAVQAVGEDEVRRSYEVGNDLGEEIEQYVVGNRVVAISCLVRSNLQTLASSARSFLEKLRTKAVGPASVATLDALGLGFGEVLPIVEIPDVRGQRKYSLASMDFLFTAAVEEQVESTGYITSVELTSNKLKNAAGPIADPLQIDEVLP